VPLKLQETLGLSGHQIAGRAAGGWSGWPGHQSSPEPTLGGGPVFYTVASFAKRRFLSEEASQEAEPCL
jgi:hypothetical protein